jgi:hypothetical protein
MCIIPMLMSISIMSIMVTPVVVVAIIRILSSDLPCHTKGIRIPAPDDLLLVVGGQSRCAHCVCVQVVDVIAVSFMAVFTLMIRVILMQEAK